MRTGAEVAVLVQMWPGQADQEGGSVGMRTQAGCMCRGWTAGARWQEMAIRTSDEIVPGSGARVSGPLLGSGSLLLWSARKACIAQGRWPFFGVG